MVSQQRFKLGQRLARLRVNIAGKMVGTLLLVVTLMIVVGGLALVRFNQLQGTVQRLVGGVAAERQVADDLVAQILSVRLAENRYVRTQQPADLEAFNSDWGQLATVMSQANTVLTGDQRRSLLARIETDAKSYQGGVTEIVGILNSRAEVQTLVLDLQGPIVETNLESLRNEAYVGGNTIIVQAAAKVETSVLRMRLDAFKFETENDPQSAQQFETDYAEAQKAFGLIDPATLGADQKQFIKLARAATDTYAQGFESLKSYCDRQAKIQSETLDTLGPSIRDNSTEIAASVDTEFSAAQASTNQSLAKTRLILISTMIAAAVLALGAGLLAARTITAPLLKVTHLADQIAENDLPALAHHMQSLAQGDLTHRLLLTAQPLAVDTGDEVAQLAGAFNTMIARMRDVGEADQHMTDYLLAMVSQVTDSASSVARASDLLAATAEQAQQSTSQITATIQQVAQGTQQQTEAVTRTAGSVDGMKQSIDVVARGAQEQAQAASRASELTSQISEVIRQVAANAESGVLGSTQAAAAARGGAQTVAAMVTGMEAIRVKVGQSAEKVTQMGLRSSQIGMIVETIDDIAGQTNLLALNAAIEAARAGEHGQGFAVVADEVRKLAERSRTATKEIGGLIQGIRQTVAEAVLAMDEGAREVASGVARANQAGQALESILASSAGVNEQVQSIASAAARLGGASANLVEAMDSVSAIVAANRAATQAMALSSREATQAIENIASVSEENSAAVEEVSASAVDVNTQVDEVTASAQALRDLAARLRQVVDQFRLADQTAVSTPPPHAPRSGGAPILQAYQQPAPPAALELVSTERHNGYH